jgi:hypothetical protein
VNLTAFLVGPGGVETVTGTFNWDEMQWAIFFIGSASWDHGMIADFGIGTGDLAPGFAATIHSACTGAEGFCTAVNQTSPDPQNIGVTPLSTQEFEWLESDDGPASTSAGELTDLSFEWPLGISWSGKSPSGSTWFYDDDTLNGRCDTISTTTDGCVNPNFVPTLTLSQARYGASATMIEWAQDNLSGHWGLQGAGQPMHYLSDKIISGNNREVICDGSFSPDQSLNVALVPYNDVDSCDEFPFAASWESGAMPIGSDRFPKPHVTTGADCAQVTVVQAGTSNPLNEAADWNSIQVDGSPSGTEPCVRGHIPNNLNKAAGGAYGTMILTNRLLDGDPFWVSVTP